jgi:hypothetical protein
MASQIPANVCVALDEAMSRVFRAGGLPAGGLGKSFSAILNDALTVGGGGGSFTNIVLSTPSGTAVQVNSGASIDLDGGVGSDYLYDNAGVATFNGPLTASSFTSASSVLLTSSIASGSASTGAFNLNTIHTLSGASDLLFNVENNGVSKFSIDKSGNLTLAGTLPSSSFSSSVASGAASAGAFQFNTTNTLSGASDLLLNIMNNTVSEFTLDKTGNASTSAGSYSVTGATNGANAFATNAGGVISLDGAAQGAYIWSNTVGNVFTAASKVVDGASAVGFKMATNNSLSTSGALHTTWYNASTQIMSLDKSGNVQIAGPTLTLGGSSGVAVTYDSADGFLLLNSSGHNGVLVIGKLVPNTTTYDLGQGGGNLSWRDLYLSGVFRGTSTTGSTELLSSVANGSATNGAIQINTVSTLSTTGDLLFNVENNGSQKFYIDYAGNYTTVGTASITGGALTLSNVTAGKIGLSITNNTGIDFSGAAVGGAYGTGSISYNNPQFTIGNSIAISGYSKSQGRIASWNFQTATGTSYTVAAKDEIVGMSDDATRTLTLLHAAAAGTCITVRDTSGSSTSGHTITISVATSGNIDGASTYVITPGTSLCVQLVSDGTNYWSIAKF